MSVKVNFRLPEELVEKADAAAEIAHGNRTEIVKRALQQYLREMEDDEKLRQELVELYLDGEIRFKVLEEFIGKQDADAVKNSREILEEAGELAEELAET